MNLSEYFDKVKGLGVLSTSDEKGNVDAALYARPHIMEDKTIVLIMADRLSHANLQKNPKAVYLFKEDGNLYDGVRLYLTKIKETEDQALFDSIKRGKAPSPAGNNGKLGKNYLVHFRLDDQRPLIGD